MSGHPVIVVGGVGGSGTRVVAELLRSAGYYIGSDLNEAADNLWSALLFNRRDVLTESDDRFNLVSTLFFDRMQGTIGRKTIDLAREIVPAIANQPNPQHQTDWLLERTRTFLDLTEGERQPDYWGWKSPPTHVVIDRLFKFDARVRYIHVTRNGLDMALSPNQNQLKMWGPVFLGSAPDITPRNSLAYWCVIERRVRAIADHFPGRIKLVDFDALCLEPRRVASDILAFCGKPFADHDIDHFASTVARPASTGRFRTHGHAGFDPADVAYVAALGYPVV